MKLPTISKRLRATLTIGVLALTVIVFIHYFGSHPEQLRQLRHISPLLLVELLALYSLIIVALVFVLQASLAVVNVRIGWLENFMLTSYSSIVNFFGPLQSGPGVRLVYLKQKHGVTLKQFMFGTFLYYGFFALFSGIFLSIRALPWWLTAPFIIGIAGLSYVVIKRKGSTGNFGRLNRIAIINLALATLCQVLLLACLYFLELHSIDPHISFWQAMTYTGAANFALFVSLTPGAIGFRESFLLFSQKLHGIDSSQILSASLIDRATNVTFLGLLFVITLSLHLKDRFIQKETAKGK